MVVHDSPCFIRLTKTHQVGNSSVVKNTKRRNEFMNFRYALAAGFMLAAITGGTSRPAVAAINQAEAAAEDSSPRVPQIASNLLGQVHSLAEHLKTDAATLEYLNRANHSRRSQVHALHEIRDEVGSAGRLLGQLLQVRDELQPWQQQAIDHISPTLESLAARTEAVIQHVEANRDPAVVPEYQEAVSAMAQVASEVHDSLGDYLVYAEGQQRLDQLIRSFDEKA
jgi:hypothetical protein